ncbi:hypothetical protein [Kineosporia sp. A_224]|uniref:hypothetical protein n=1 Tax=Kineosporia sp. A_224 TaxID=1962180 RepID=UPI00117B43E9|nr:hypothetical protein [Kineosporia sp. A_224]
MTRTTLRERVRRWVERGPTCDFCARDLHAANQFVDADGSAWSACRACVGEEGTGPGAGS